MLNFKDIENKWQKKWRDNKIFEVKEENKTKFYNLEMFPYPSGSGLHMGHVRNYVIGDVYSRFKRMNGFNVLYPMGYDAFGLPAENAAIKSKVHPKKHIQGIVKGFREQLNLLGQSYDWTREIATCYPEYYKWNQWFFLKFLENGLAYRKKAPINWCNSCGTVLANEQVVGGKCWRCESSVEIKDLEQWFLKITNYAEELLKSIDALEGWPERIKTMQKNWIGKSKGTLINFKLMDSDDVIPIFTTRPDTIFGVTFLVYAPEHPKVMELVKDTKHEKDVKELINKVVLEERFTRTEGKEKEGIFIGRYAINPLTGNAIPIYIANFVLLDYGTGAIMAVPAHDQRDFEFAKKYDIPIRVVISPDYDLDSEKMIKAYVEDGSLINSGKFDGINNKDAMDEISKFIERKQFGKITVQYKLRDWLISRQRYWGTPIPVVYCDKCGIVPVDEKDLPILLPENVEFTGEGNPLAKHDLFVNTKCNKCGGKARRETDTMDTFFDSSWYFLRYCSPDYEKGPFDKEKVRYWMPVDQYIGGAEHAVMHLLYARFFTKVLRDLKMLDFDEPFVKLFNQGMLHKDGVVMSKSKGNIVTQDEIAEKYGVDTARVFLMFISSPSNDIDWSDNGIEGTFRFLNRVYGLLDKLDGEDSKNIESRLNKTIKDVTKYIDNFEYNLALVEIIGFVNYLYKAEGNKKEAVNNLVLMLSPFAPHLAEEMWEKLGNKGFVSMADWPSYDESKIDEELLYSEDLVDIISNDIRRLLKLIKIEPKKVTLFVADEWKYDLVRNIKRIVKETRDIKGVIEAIMIKEHADEIRKLIPRLVNDVSKIPQVILDQDKEYRLFVQAKDVFEKEFNLKFQVKKNSEKALPGKPALLIE